MNFRFSAFLFGYLSLLVASLVDNARGPYFLDIMEGLSLTNTQASMMFVVGAVFSFLGSFSSSYFARKLTIFFWLRVGIFIAGVGFYLLATIRSYLGLMVVSALLGYGVGLVSVFDHLAVECSTLKYSRKKLFSGLHSVYAFASLLVPLVIGLFFRLGLDWRQGVMWLTLAPVLFLVATMRDPVCEKKHESKLEAERNENPPPWYVFSFVSLILASYVAAELILSTRLVVYLREVEHYSPELASVMLSGFFVFLFIGRILFTFLGSHRWRGGEVLRVSLQLSFTGFLLGLFFHPIGFLFCGFTMAPFFASAIDFAMEIFHKWPAKAMSYSMSSVFVSVVVMNFLAGYVADTYGLKESLVLGPGFILISLMFLKNHKKIVSHYVK